MQKTYVYEPKGYRFRIIWVGYIMVVIAVVLAVMFILKPTEFLYLFGIGAAAYGALNTFVFKSNPKEIVIDDETISFVSFGQAKYNIAELTTFNVREFSNAQFYIRVEEKNGKRGRYWVQYYYFLEREELIKELYHIEKQVHPSNLKFRGRENMFDVRPCYAPSVSDEQELEVDPFFSEQ